MWNKKVKNKNVPTNAKHCLKEIMSKTDVKCEFPVLNVIINHLINTNLYSSVQMIKSVYISVENVKQWGGNPSSPAYSGSTWGG